MSSDKFVDMFFHKKYIDWDEYQMRIEEYQEEHYEKQGDDRNMAG